LGGPRLRAIWLLLPLLLLAPSGSIAQSSDGSIVGQVTDAATGKPIAYAQIVILGTEWGAMAVEDGTYVIRNVPPGTYDVKVMMIGYEDQTKKGVVVQPGQETRVDFAIKETVVDIGLNEVVVKGRRKQLIQKKKSTTEHRVTAEELTNLPVDELEEAISLKAGVVAQAGQLHFRGGRAGEVQYQVDGVPVRDPLVGGGVSLATLAVEDAEVILGGLDAQYGNAQSGVVNYITKEGGDHFEGEIRYMTDDYGAPDNTFDNLDRIFVGIGGPTPIRNLTFYVSAEGTYQDDYPKTPERRSRHRILNFISVGDRKTNTLKLQGKLAYRPSPKIKMTFEVINNFTKSDNYYHMWSREGYVETFFDTTRTGRVVLRHGRWSPVQVDSTYQYYNAAEHTPNVIDKFNQIKFVMNHTINKDTYYSLKVSRQYFFRDRRVKGKEPWEYDGERESDFWFNYHDFEPYDFFVISGDYPTLSTRETKVYRFKFDFTRRYEKHRFQTGVDFSYNDMRYFQVDRPYLTNANGEIGGTRTRYHYYNPEGAFYIQDRWEHEGMVLNIGLRYDAFSVGDQIPVSEVRNRVKTQWSPRIGIAYPISDRDVFSFHYGRFYQFPDRRFIFDDRNVYDGRVRGNPNLENETTVSYQAGIQHLFSDIVFGQFSVYYKDIFGLITAQEVPDPTGTGNVRLYTNKDYASARGFELTLMRQFRNNFRAELSYTYGVATGVASDPNAAVSQNFLYLPVSEQPLDWDARHQFSAQLYVADPGAWGVNIVWSYTSGYPYTPIQRDTRELGPEAVNSRRLPSTTSLDVQAEKYYTLWGQRFRVFLQSRNLLDTKNIFVLEPGNWPPPPSSVGSDYVKYYTETGKAGGAYIGDDVNGDGIEDWVPLHDPRVFSNPRTIRVGVGFEF
jgi:outer membrane receptor for ferrienterochelin and colicin